MYENYLDCQWMTFQYFYGFGALLGDDFGLNCSPKVSICNLGQRFHPKTSPKGSVCPSSATESSENVTESLC